ncbi:MAG: hypothetical protein M1814_005138 [Vezdaea aestivalis]|nr:MAG: hypothetical protein M1814_005138 [Vezdaea aestivalis]
MAQSTQLSDLVGTAACFDISVFNTTTLIVADPDIAGIGVISAFIIAAGTAVSSCILYTFVDEIFQPSTSIARSVKIKLHFLGLLPEDFQLVRILASLHDWILALSDQQLITGLAVLIAAFARWDRIPIYHFDIALSLAFCSSNTHLATLFVLAKELRKKKMRPLVYVRLAGMFALFLMLFVANIFSGYRYWYDDVAWPMRCVVLTLSKSLKRYYGGKPAIYAYLWASLLLIDYSIAFGSMSQRICEWTRVRVDRELYHAMNEIKNRCNRLHIRWSMWDAVTLGGSIASWMLFTMLKTYNSKLRFLMQILAWYLYNVSTMMLWRRDHQSDLDDARKEADISGFGQLLPLIMLVVPGIALLESFLR